MASEDPHTRADIDFHEATAQHYEDALEPLFRPYRGLIVEPYLDSLGRLALGRDALDLGCGTGAMTLKLAERGFCAQGVDHSPAMLAIAERNAQERGLSDRVAFRTGDVRALRFDAESFDVVTCQGMLHHLADLQPCLSELERVLRPGGMLYLAEPCRGSTPAIRVWDRLAAVVGRLHRSPPDGGRAAWPTDIPEHDGGRSTPASCRRSWTALDSSTTSSTGPTSTVSIACVRSGSSSAWSSPCRARGASAPATWLWCAVENREDKGRGKRLVEAFENTKALQSEGFQVTVEEVAGAGFEPATFGL